MKRYFLFSALLLSLSLSAVGQVFNNPGGTISTCSGTFNDEGGASGDYLDNSNIVTTICPSTPGSIIHVSFTSFDLEVGSDFLQVFDGNSTSAPLMSTCSGTIGPGAVMATPTNTSGCITFVFISNGVGTASGWTADISCSVPCQTIVASIPSTIPSPNANGIIQRCQGGSVTFNGSGTFSSSGVGSTFSWDFGDGTTGTGTTATHAYTNAGGYVVKVKITDPAGCVSSNTINKLVQVSTTPTITSTALPDTICLGQSAALSAAVTMTPYTPNCTQPIAAITYLPDGTGISYLTSIPVDCYSQNQTIASAADISNICLTMEHSYLGDLQITIICPNGQSTMLKSYVSVGGGGASTYLGSPLDDPTVGPGTGASYCFTPTANTFLINGPTTLSGSPSWNSIVAGNYQPEQSFNNLIGCPLNGNWTIQVTDNLAMDDGYIFGWDINFSVPIANQAFTPTIASQGWTAAPTLTNLTNTTATSTPTSINSTCYLYSLTDNFGCTYTHPQCVVALPTGSPTFSIPDTICSSATNPLPTTSLNGVAGTWSPAFSTTTSPATYTFTPTSGLCAGTATKTLIIKPSTNTTFNAVPAICEGEAITPLPTTSLNGFSGTWSPPYNNTITTTYTFTPSPLASSDCLSSAQLTITVNQAPVIDAGLDQSVCIGDSTFLLATVSLSSANTTLTWDQGIQNNVFFTPITTTTYTLTGIDINNCTSTDQVTLTIRTLPIVGAGADTSICSSSTFTPTGTGASTYTWDNSAVNNVPMTLTTGNHTLTVIGTDTFGCKNSDQLIVNVSQAAIANASIDQALCAGKSIQLDGSTNTSVTSTLWTASSGTFGNASSLTSSYTPSITSGTVTLTLTTDDPAGPCPAVSDQLIVSINPTPIVSAGTDKTACLYDVVTLQGTGAAAYAWNNGITNNVAFQPALGTNLYTVIGTSALGCKDTDDIQVIVHPLPTIDFSVDIQKACAPRTIQFISQAPTAVNCLWQMSNGLVLNGCGTVSANFNNVGCYDATLTVVDANSCINTYTQTSIVCLVDKPIADFTPSTSIIYETSGNVEFYNNSQNAVNYFWDFGDNSTTATSTLTQPIHTFQKIEAATYEVMLVAMSIYPGCEDTTYRKITILEPLLYFIPNTFTPDNNSFNNTFKPVFTSGVDPFNYHLSIYDRWGELVFESYDASIGWAGNYYTSEILAQEGTYTWVIDFNLKANDGQEKITGYVNLLR